MGSTEPWVVDANVLIDYVKSDRTVLALVAKHLGTLHVPSALLEGSACGYRS